MTLKIRFSKSRSENYAAAVSHCEKFPSYRTWAENGVTWHVVEVEDWGSWQSIVNFVGGWKSCTYCLNGEYQNLYDLWAMWTKQKDDKERLEEIANKRILADTAPKNYKFN